MAVDALLYDTQTNSTGYKRADFNLDGVVSNDDRDSVLEQQHRAMHGDGPRRNDLEAAP